jgi:predicted dehydrogenase
MNTHSPVSFGVVGLGGYAGNIARHLQALEADDNPPIKLVSTCDPDLITHAKVADDFKARGVRVYDSIDALLESPVDAVWLPVPIDLHRPFTEKALAAGKAVMCEKPAAGCVDDLDAMIAARDRAGLPVGIGFQDTHADTTSQLKRRLLDGEIGRITHATVYASWPREDRYYARASWAGALKRNGTWVLDSPANNAISHFIMLPLFMLGTTMDTAAAPQSIEAELYRGRPTIENFDTISLRAVLPGGVTLLVLMTHACQQTLGPVVTIHGEKGTLTRVMNEMVLATNDGRSTTIPVGDKHADMVRRFAELVRGHRDADRPVVSLELARHQLVCVNAATQCTPIHDVPTTHADGRFVISDIETMFARCADRNVMLNESGLAPWSKPPGSLDVRDYRHFAGPHS